MADLLEYFAGLLRGGLADPEAPGIEALPSSSRVARAMERLARATERAGEEWGKLPPDIRDGMTSPDQVMDGVEE